MPSSKRTSDQVVRIGDWPTQLVSTLNDAERGIVAALDQMRDGLLLIDTLRGGHHGLSGEHERPGAERLIYVNDAALEILGRAAAPAQARRLDDLLAAPVVEALRRNNRDGHSGVVESERYVIYGPLRINAGSQAVLVIRRREPNAAEAAQVPIAAGFDDWRQLLQAMDAVPHGFCLFDANDRLVLCNRAYLGMSRFLPEDQVIGRTFEDLVRLACRRGTMAPEHGSEDEFIAARLIARNRPYGEAEQHRGDGTWLRVTETRLRNGSLVGIYTDITAQKRYEAELIEKREHFEALHRRTPAMMHTVDANRRIMSVSDYWLDRLGYSREEVVGRNSTEFFDPTTVARANAEFWPQLMKAGSVRDLPFTIIAKSGERVDTLLSAVAERDAAGETVRVITVMADVGALNRTEAKLRESELRYRLLAESSLIIPYTSNTAREGVQYIGPRIVDLLGYPSEDWQDPGMLRSVVHPEDIERVFDQIDHMFGKQGLTESMDFQREYRLVGRGDKVVWVKDVSTLEPAPDGSIEIRGFLIDITEGKVREQVLASERAEMRRLKNAAEAANRAKSDFLANMSHELRTPLNAVIGFAEALEHRLFGDLNQKQSEYINDIKTAGVHLLAMINDILDMAKIEAGRQELNESVFEVGDVIEGSLRFIAEHCKRRRLTLRRALSPDLPNFLGDERAIRQVLINLLSNAAKFTPEDGQVGISANVNPAGDLEISVADTGVGIDPRQIGTVMEPFRQVANAMTRQVQGTGLGLSISRSIVELHGGTIGIVSQPGQGTVVTVTLPKSRLATARA